jgi:amidase
MRQSQSGTPHDVPYNGALPLSTSRFNFSTCSTILWSIAIMILARFFVAFAPLTSVWAQYGTESKFPALLDATAEDLTLGLERGDFTSVDLVKVCTRRSLGLWAKAERRWKIWHRSYERNINFKNRAHADLDQAYVGRILEVNSTLHMVTEINPDAWAIAAHLDAERANGTIRGCVVQFFVVMEY